MKTLLILLLLISTSAKSDDWSSSDTYREAAYLTLHAADWLQTRQIARGVGDRYETNVILGDHPSIEKVDTYFALTALAHVGIAYMMPSDLRSYFQYFTIIVESDYVTHNLNAGIKIKF